MSAIALQITNDAAVTLITCSSKQQSKQESCASLTPCKENPLVIGGSLTKGQYCGSVYML